MAATQASRTSAQNRQFSISLDDQTLDAVDLIARTLVPPTSRSRAIGYLIGLGIAEHRKRQTAQHAPHQPMAV